MQPADFVWRDVDEDRLEAAGRCQPRPLGLDQPRQVGVVEHKILVEHLGECADDLLGGQPAQGLHDDFQIALAELRFDFFQAPLLGLLISLFHQREDLLLVGPADVQRQAEPPHLDRRRRAIDQDDRPQPRCRREVEIAKVAKNLRVLGVLAQVLEEEESRIRRVLDEAERGGRLAGIGQHLGGPRREQAVGERPLGDVQTHLLRRIADNADSRVSSGVAIEMIGLPAAMRSLRVSGFMGAESAAEWCANK